MCPSYLDGEYFEIICSISLPTVQFSRSDERRERQLAARSLKTKQHAGQAPRHEAAKP